MKEKIKQLLEEYSTRIDKEVYLRMFSDGSGCILDLEDQEINKFDDEAELINILKG